MFSKLSTSTHAIVVMAIVLVGVAACDGSPAPISIPVPTVTLPSTNPQAPAPTSAAASNQPAQQPQQPPNQPAPTAAPAAAAIVNGQSIPLAVYQQQTAQFQAALVQQGLNPDSPDGQAQLATMRQQVLDNMIDDALIAQEAAKEGVAVTDADLDAAMQKLIVDAGGQAAFEQALAASGQTLDDARTLQRTQMLNNLIRDRIIAKVGDAVEQVHARHILVDSQATADALLSQIQAGADFAQVAAQSSQDNLTRVNGGDLGWFPRGVLISKEVEDAAFALQPGQISGVVQSAFGFHIVQVIDRDPARKVEGDQLLKLQQAAVEQWLAGLRAAAQVQKLVSQ